MDAKQGHKASQRRACKVRASVMMLISISQIFIKMNLLWLHDEVQWRVIIYGFFKLLNGLRRQGHP